MRKIYMVMIVLVASATLFLLACGKNYNTSKHGGNKSHLSGALCITCHAPGGKAKETFTVSGTVYDESRLKVQQRSVVKLYTRAKARGKLIATLYTDDLGNFYTTQKIDFTQGLYPTLSGTPGARKSTRHMSKGITSGDCNSCHGMFTGNLGID
ncbi:MAG TPA: hypothetical protein VGO58_00210 [Chitinophagaceae bacterium]|nr:hypothetical protein [Chitinophagaceae bacterium]